MASTLTRTLLVAFTLGLVASCSSTNTTFPSLSGSGGGGTTSSVSSTSSSASAGTGGMGTGAADGGVTDGSAADGDAGDGEVTDGGATDGGATDGEATDGEADGSADDGGACVHACTTASDCPAQATLCLVNVCNGGCCGTGDAPANTSCSDDGGHYCDGEGVCRACLSATQCPASTTACATPVCTANACSSTYAAKGFACSDANGTVCNGAGMCTAATCSDGVRDGTETDIDCGGSCPSCGDGKTCKTGADCTDKACSGTPLTCQAPTCTDGTQDGTETDVDCGGSACPACATAKACARSTDCLSMNCVGLRCAASSCSDGIQNGTETDVDCGGNICLPCATTKMCAKGSDCASLSCLNLHCALPTCGDGVQNGNETDVDCGGTSYQGAAACPPCGTGGKCSASGANCVSRVCTGNGCAAATCSDGVQNGTETDIDCGGGTCPACANYKVCVTSADCTSLSCVNQRCAVPTCTDGVQNGNESDVDCGGTSYQGVAACPPCGTGAKCGTAGTNCLSHVCTGGACAAPTCSDGVQNGAETDVDCGGGTCPACATSKQCVKGTDCASLSCIGLKCAAPTCSDGVQNGNETDVDCGGTGYLSASPCPACGTGLKCGTSGTNCVNRVCTGGTCAAPTCSDGVQNGNESDVDCGGTSYKGATACAACNPGQKCGAAADCVGNTCQGTCQCPSGMLPVPIQGGGIYCIDSIEVTYGSYNAFYSANPPTSSQDPWCTWNPGWTPAGAWPYLPVNQLEPVRYVNWCQAAGYCKYLGRRLCGQIGGGPVPQASFNDFSKDQWFDACTAQGANCSGGGCYPYGAAYISKECNGADSAVGGPEPYTSLPNCQGGEPGLLNMSGNVAEWEDSCDARTGNGDQCAIRGGSYADDSSGLRCDSDQDTLPLTESRSYTGNDVGFRCCL